MHKIEALVDEYNKIIIENIIHLSVVHDATKEIKDITLDEIKSQWDDKKKDAVVKIVLRILNILAKKKEMDILAKKK